MREFYLRYGKRYFDLFVSIVSLVVLLPVFLLVAVAIKLEDGGPIFFFQERVGRDFSTFKVVKFRTMTTDPQVAGPLVTSENDKRITKVGKILRKLKIDELPQIFNVLRGEMSIVGPRPEVPKYVKLFEKDYRKLLTVRPGMTGYASVVFRNEEQVLSRYTEPEIGYVTEILPKKTELELIYVSRVSFILDIKIFLWTFLKILAG